MVVIHLSGAGDYYCSGNDLNNFMGIDPKDMAKVAQDSAVLLEWVLLFYGGRYIQLDRHWLDLRYPSSEVYFYCVIFILLLCHTFSFILMLRQLLVSCHFISHSDVFTCTVLMSCHYGCHAGVVPLHEQCCVLLLRVPCWCHVIVSAMLMSLCVPFWCFVITCAMLMSTFCCV